MGNTKGGAPYFVRRRLMVSPPFPKAAVLQRTSAFPRKEPRVVSIARFGCRVIRIPIAAKPLFASLLPREGGGAEGDGG